MAKIETIITDHLDVWSSAIKQRNTQGRGSSKKQELYGIQKLRELILELAVRGLLVPQDPSEGTGKELIQLVSEEKKGWIKSGKIKKLKEMLPISKDELSQISLPENWAVARLGSLFETVYGKGLANNELLDSGYKVFGANGIIGNYSSYLYDEPQLLVSCRGAYSGKPNISPEKCFVTSNSLVLQNDWNHLDLRFFYYALSIADKAEIVTGSAQPQVTTTNLDPFLIQVPPLAEQKRIVEKVDELMALCDQLEERQENSITAHQQLVEVLLAALTQATDAETFEQAWAHLAANFDTLFTTENSIEQLKQTLLQLAVMGKLVPQDPNDEPASVLLEKIAAEKEKLIKEGKIKKQKPLLKIENNETLLPLPNGSEWVRLGDLSLNSEAGWSPRCEGHPRTKSNWGVLKVSAVTWGEFNPNENKELPANLEPREKYEVLPRDFLISRANTAELVARAVVVPEIAPKKLMMSDKIIRFRFSKEVDVTFIKLVNDSQKARDYYAVVAGGTSSSMKNVSREQIRNLQFVLPPLAEQKRIVEKVDQLFAICDQLKEKIRTAEETQLQLADALTSQAIQ